MGAAAAGGIGLSGAEAADREKKSVKGWRPPRDRARQRLVDMAEFGRKKGASGKRGIAVCTHPLASAAAVDMLKLGGNAADAACAASIAQCVVETHMTTLSGVFSMLYYDAASGEVSYVNGSMGTPKSHPIFTSELSDLVPILTKERDGSLCPVPGYWGGFEASHDRHGVLPRQTVMAPAIHYAREGFEIHPFLWGEMFVESAQLGSSAQGQEMYFRDQRLLNVGETLVQSRHADTLERLAEEGSDYFYRGEFAENYVRAVRDRGGYVTREDMEAWAPIWGEPVRSTYRDYEIVGSPAPDYGGQAVVEIMNMVELIDLQKLGPAFESPETALKLMQIVGQTYSDAIGARFTNSIPPVETMISKETAEARFAQLSGKPRNPYEQFLSPPPGSNQVTVVDEQGNAATVMHSIMSLPYSTGIFVDGVYVCAGLLHLASGIPGSDMRTHSRVAPNMFLKDGKPVLVSGSPSVSLTECIVQNSINILDFGLDIETSVHKPRFGGSSMNNFLALMIERDMGDKTIDRLRKEGAAIEVVNPWNWTHGSFDGVAIDANGVASACGDPRRTAAALTV